MSKGSKSRQAERLDIRRPKDPHTLARLRSRGRLSAVSRNYSQSPLPDERQDACIAAGAKVQSRPRLDQSGLLTGQQYWVRKDYARQKAQSKATKLKFASQVPQPQRLTRSTSGPHRGITVVSPEQRRLKAGPASEVRAGWTCVERRVKKVEPSSEVLQNQRVTGTGRGPCRMPAGVTPSRVGRHPARSSVLRGLSGAGFGHATSVGSGSFGFGFRNAYRRGRLMAGSAQRLGQAGRRTHGQRHNGDLRVHPRRRGDDRPVHHPEAGHVVGLEIVGNHGGLRIRAHRASP